VTVGDVGELHHRKWTIRYRTDPSVSQDVARRRATTLRSTDAKAIRGRHNVAFQATDDADSSGYGDVTFKHDVTYDAEKPNLPVPAGVAGFTVTVAGGRRYVRESDENVHVDGWRRESTAAIENGRCGTGDSRA